MYRAGGTGNREARRSECAEHVVGGRGGQSSGTGAEGGEGREHVGQPTKSSEGELYLVPHGSQLSLSPSPSLRWLSLLI